MGWGEVEKGKSRVSEEQSKRINNLFIIDRDRSCKVNKLIHRIFASWYCSKFVGNFSLAFQETPVVDSPP